MIRWSQRDCIAAIGLFLATAAVILWQNAHVAVLFDLSYILNTATRIALGQMPYRDFPLPHAPLTFLIQAGIIRLTGRVFFHHALYVALVGGLGTGPGLAHCPGTAARAREGRLEHCIDAGRAAYGAGNLLHRSQPRVRLRLRLLDSRRGVGAGAGRS